MGKIYATDREGRTHELEGRNGYTLMEITRDAGLPVAAICGGNCICTTCHMYIAEDGFAKLDPPSDTEQALLEDSGAHQPTSRLGCQVKFSEELDGLKLTLAPEF
jgi:2Fe-2S ferredoxin